MNIAVVVGNPKPDSRTLDAARLLATDLVGVPPAVVIDVITLGAGLLGWGDPDVASAVSAVRASDVAVIASPTFKGAYTGVLKLFLDQFPSGGLEGVTALPVMLGAGPMHAMAPDLVLKPVLVELGATCPVKGLYLLDSSYRDAAVLDPWLVSARRALPATASA
jgi:FMN reductase